MKKSTAPFILILAITSSALAEISTKPQTITAEQKVEAYYKRAERAFNDGDKKTATDSLRRALKINPNHGPSYALALQLKKGGPVFKAKGRQNQLASIILPEIELRDIPLSDALQILSTLIEEKSEQKFFPNFVIQDQTGTLRKKKVSLNLKNVPANVVLDYLVKMTEASVKFSEYAITVAPLQS